MRITGHNDVVVTCAIDFKQPQIGFGPMNPVGRFGVTGEAFIVLRRWEVGQAVIVKPEAVRVLEDREEA